MKSLRFAIVALVLLAGHPARGGEPPSNLCRVVAYTIHDGDGIEHATILLGWGVAMYDRNVRDITFDTHELTRNRQTQPFASFTEAQWAAEIAAGKADKTAFETLLKKGTVYVSPTVKTPYTTYDRLIGKLYVWQPDGTWLDVAKAMKDSGHTR